MYKKHKANVNYRQYNFTAFLKQFYTLQKLYCLLCCYIFISFRRQVVSLLCSP